MIKYRPEIDGLRTVAIVPVIMFHLGYSGIQGGYLGVDVFFVISGYLITSIIIRELANDTFSFVNFWKRRVRRILPALLVMTITTLLTSLFISFRPDVRFYGRDAVSAVFSYANISMLLKFRDYWGSAAHNSPFLHAWSLSVEEQFYFVYPILLFFLHRYKASLKLCISIIVFISIVLFVFGVFNYPNHTFFLLPFRAWELAAGAAIAAARRDSRPSGNVVSHVVPVIGLLLIFTSFFVTFNHGGIGISAILPVLGTSLIIWSSKGDDFVGKFLSVKPMVYIGKISYSLYLWHWPVIVLSGKLFVRSDFNHGAQSMIRLAAISILSLLSYFLVERTTRKSPKTIGVVLLTGVFAVGLAFFVQSSLLNDKYISKFAPVEFYGLKYDISPTIKEESDALRAKREGIVAPRRNPNDADAYRKQGILCGKEGKGDPDLLLLGDSHGAMWGALFDDISQQLDLKISIYTSVGNSPLFDFPIEGPQDKTQGYTSEQRRDYARSLAANIEKWSPFGLVIACKWSSFSSESYTQLERFVKWTIDFGVHVVLLTQPPVIDAIGDVNSSQCLSYLGYQPQKGTQYIKVLEGRSVVEGNRKVKSIASKYENCDVIDIYPNYAFGDMALIIENNRVLYYDDDHLSYQGTLVSKSDIMMAVSKLLE